MIKILMVCLGNICRSPLAEGILKSKLPSNNFVVDSAGTASYHIGNPPDKRSIAIARKHGLDISNQKARQFVTADFKTFDHIFVMDTANYQNVLTLSTDKKDDAKVDFILNAISKNQDLDVPDPYYGGDQGFENVYNMLEEACSVISKRLTSY